nr:immunoglobulin light chain junction region [Macaca mulatta]MPO07786.1 immunoglobulin light chain junction region [Macaca mulatta]MPO07987.1 immunoglobulin light chain junction region [Macaca mulatta]MPO09677.1 immunoglobulin light chain junction region [Macaca mulatta]MPO09713.1 immunoglobulin light chain junction region [Macaca mulatta]
CAAWDHTLSGYIF